jgi:hypothetical protein
MTCHISLESSQQKPQLCFRPRLNQKCAQKAMGLQKLWASKMAGVPISRKMTFGCNPHGHHKKYYKEEGDDESCEFVYSHDSSMHQKCSNYALTNKFVQIHMNNDLLVTHLSPRF